MAKANLKEFGNKVLKHVRAGVRSSAGLVQERLKQNVGLTDHSQLDLDDLGNPYAKRDYRPPHQPEYLVHRQTSRLYNSISIRREGEDTFAIGADETLTDPQTGERYVISVIEGNSKMVARNYPLETLNELKEEKILEKSIEESIEKALE